MDDNHTTFYKVWSYLKDDPVLTAGMRISMSIEDDLDQLIWSALGHTDAFQLGCTVNLSSFDLDRLQMIRPPHGVTIFKMMLARGKCDV